MNNKIQQSGAKKAVEQCGINEEIAINNKGVQINQEMEMPRQITTPNGKAYMVYDYPPSHRTTIDFTCTGSSLAQELFEVLKKYNLISDGADIARCSMDILHREIPESCDLAKIVQADKEAAKAMKAMGITIKPRSAP